MKTLAFYLKVSVSENWINDGWDGETIAERLKEFIEADMNPYANSHEEFQANIIAIKESNSEGQKFARKCDFTGEGMNEGWCFGDGQVYAKYKGDATKQAEDWGYQSLEDAFEDGAVYWSEWEDEEDIQYIVKNGKVVEIDDCES
jgi:hypothetical protein